MRFDIPLIAGKFHFGFRGLGVPAASIPSTGDDGPAFGFPSVEAADAGKELRFLVTRRPAGGTFFVYEDSSFTYTGPSDSFDFTKYRNGIAAGSATATLNMGVVLVHADFAQSYAILSSAAPALVADFPQAYAIAESTQGDVTPPLLIGAINVDLLTHDTIGFSCPVATDGTAVTGYEYSINGAPYVSNGTARNVVLGGLSFATAYEVRMVALDAAGNRSVPLALIITTLDEPLPVIPDATPAPTLASRSLAWLKDATARWSHRSDLGPMMDDFVMLAEKRISEDIDARLQVAVTTLNTVRRLDVVLMPSDMADVRALSIGDEGPLEYLPPEAFAKQKRYGVKGKPRFFTVLGPYINLYPVPLAVYSMACAYRQKIPSLLDEPDGVNWLIRDHADIYLSAVMCEALNYVENVAKLQVWQQKYAAAIAALNMTDWHSGSSMCIRSDSPTV